MPVQSLAIFSSIETTHRDYTHFDRLCLLKAHSTLTSKPSLETKTALLLAIAKGTRRKADATA